MKTLSKLKTQLTLTVLALACGFVAQTATVQAATHDMGDNDYIRVTIPEASMATAQVVYTIEDNKVEAIPSDGEIIKLHAEKDGLLGKLFFSAVEETEDSFLIQMTATQPFGLDHHIFFKSTGESAIYDGGSPIYINAAGATVEVVPVGGLDEILSEPPQNIAIGEESQDFSKVGFLEVRFVVKAAAQPDDGQNPGDGGNDGDNNADPQAASGGCSMVAGAQGGSALSLAGFAMASALSLALRRRANRK